MSGAEGGRGVEDGQRVRGVIACSWVLMATAGQHRRRKAAKDSRNRAADTQHHCLVDLVLDVRFQTEARSFPGAPSHNMDYYMTQRTETGTIIDRQHTSPRHLLAPLGMITGQDQSRHHMIASAMSRRSSRAAGGLRRLSESPALPHFAYWISSISSWLGTNF
ncbi:hypothetical protein THAOC_31717, partial [Thalassiosira oceanica]